MIRNKLNSNLSESVVKLWDNPNPNASFTHQTVNIDLSKYKKVGIVVKQTYNTTNGSVGYSETIIGLNGTLFSGNVDDPTVAYRSFSSGPNFVTFYTGHYIYSGAQGTSPDWAIPVAIYGIK